MTSPQPSTRRAVPDPQVEPTITIEEAASVLGISRTSAYAAAQRGEIPTITLGKRKVVPVPLLRTMLGLPATGGEDNEKAA